MSDIDGMGDIDNFLNNTFLGRGQERFIIAYRKFTECQNKVEREKNTQITTMQTTWWKEKFFGEEEEVPPAVQTQFNNFLTRRQELWDEKIAFREKEFFKQTKDIIEFNVNGKVDFLVNRKKRNNRKFSINSLFCPTGSEYYRELTTHKPFYALVSYENRKFKLINIFTNQLHFVNLNDENKLKLCDSVEGVMISGFLLKTAGKNDVEPWLAYHTGGDSGGGNLVYEPSRNDVKKPTSKATSKRKRSDEPARPPPSSHEITTYRSPSLKKELEGILAPKSDHVGVLKRIYIDAYGLNTCSRCDNRKCRIHMVLDSDQLICFTCNGIKNKFKPWTYTPNDTEKRILGLTGKNSPVSLSGDDRQIRKMMDSTNYDNVLVKMVGVVIPRKHLVLF